MTEQDHQLRLIEDYYYSFALNLEINKLFLFVVYGESKKQEKLMLMFLNTRYIHNNTSCFKFLCLNTGEFLYFLRDERNIKLSQCCLFKISEDEKTSIREIVYKIDKIYRIYQ